MARSFEFEVPPMTVLAVCVWQAVSNAPDHVHSLPFGGLFVSAYSGREILAKTLSVGRPEAKSEACIWVNQASRGARLQQAVQIATYRGVGILALSRMRALRRHDQLTPQSRPGLLYCWGGTLGIPARGPGI